MANVMTQSSHQGKNGVRNRRKFPKGEIMARSFRDRRAHKSHQVLKVVTIRFVRRYIMLSVKKLVLQQTSNFSPSKQQKSQTPVAVTEFLNSYYASHPLSRQEILNQYSNTSDKASYILPSKTPNKPKPLVL